MGTRNNGRSGRVWAHLNAIFSSYSPSRTSTHTSYTTQHTHTHTREIIKKNKERENTFLHVGTRPRHIYMLHTGTAPPFPYPFPYWTNVTHLLCSLVMTINIKKKNREKIFETHDWLLKLDTTKCLDIKSQSPAFKSGSFHSKNDDIAKSIPSYVLYYSILHPFRRFCFLRLKKK